jgi:hypothetical protein
MMAWFMDQLEQAR